MKTKWGTSLCSAGWCFLGYVWVYQPLCEGLGINAWSINVYGISLLCFGIFLNILHLTFER